MGSPRELVFAAKNNIAAAERKPYFVVNKHRCMLNLESAM
jgi:hypothetical protein